VKRWNNRRGISIRSCWGDDQGKSELVHSCCRTAAMVSEKVSCDLWYQAEGRSRSSPRWCRSEANRVTRENSANKHGVVRAMARLAHCRWVSTPRTMLPNHCWSSLPRSRGNGCNRVGLPLGGIVRQPRPPMRQDKRSEVVAVDRQKSQKGNMIRVHSFFEPSRLEQASLQRAYERILPIREYHVRDGSAQEQTKVVPTPQRRRA
jgi:hypothetical protein